MQNLHIFISVILAITVILISSRLLGKILTLLKQPRVVGEMLAGVLLGPTFVGYFFPDFSAFVFKKELMPFLFVLSNIGLSFYMFLVGLDIDFKLFDKKLMKQSYWLSFSTIVTPFVLGGLAGVMYFTQLRGANVSLLSFSIFMGTALAITAFPMLARILEERNLVKTKIGTLTLLSASMQDVVSWICLSFVTAAALTGSYSGGLKTLGGGALFIFVMFFIIKPILKKLTKRMNKNQILNQEYMALLIVILLLSALVTDYIGLYSVFGGFIFGLIIPRETFITSGISAKLRDFTVIILLPLFFTFSGLNANMLVLGQLSIFFPCLIILLFSFIGKYFSATFVMKTSGFSWRESSAIGGLMNARGLMELLVANVGLMYGVISTTLYSILILIAIISTSLAMPIYNWSMPSLKPNNKDLDDTEELVLENEPAVILIQEEEDVLA
jgi:Kef-type K+ transport system membrane component KefB